ncbi:hypothetical protein LMG29542_06818 [Paraburkholderia humisilvae]|uniref:Uncharacterized protein n=1 Tax=Paraburkholderia humisilvae TaxID=627669 RepID=A0A6J5F3B7_9BURK|nr:hypothetical protein LMG29542_06818 [Paraburkholderia humisilvae]
MVQSVHSHRSTTSIHEPPTNPPSTPSAPPTSSHPRTGHRQPDASMGPLTSRNKTRTTLDSAARTLQAGAAALATTGAFLPDISKTAGMASSGAWMGSGVSTMAKHALEGRYGSGFWAGALETIAGALGFASSAVLNTAKEATALAEGVTWTAASIAALTALHEAIETRSLAEYSKSELLQQISQVTGLTVGAIAALLQTAAGGVRLAPQSSNLEPTVVALEKATDIAWTTSAAALVLSLVGAYLTNRNHQAGTLTNARNSASAVGGTTV